jgi:hypothetical protein
VCKELRGSSSVAASGMFELCTVKSSPVPHYATRHTHHTHHAA